MGFLIPGKCVVTLIATIVSSVGLLSAELYMENCNGLTNDSTSKFCWKPTGFFYILDDDEHGTWNYSLTEGEGLHEREVFLGLLQANNCPLTLSTSADNCANDCCYCELEFPLPRHPITGRLLLPKGLTCQDYFNSKTELSHLWQSKANQLVHHCKTSGEHSVGDPVTRLPFLCLHQDNLKQLEHAYNNPHNLSKDTYSELQKENKLKMSWRSSLAPTRNGNITRKEPSLNKQETTTESPSSTSAPETSTVNMLMEQVNQIKFSLYTDPQQEMDYVTVISIPESNMTMSFSAPTQCLSVHRKWDMYPPCWYAINVATLSSCTDLRLAVNVTSVLIHHYTSDEENVTLHIEMEGIPLTNTVQQTNSNNNESSAEADMLFNDDDVDCEEIPTHARITQVWAKGQHVVSLISLENMKSWEIVENELILTAAISQKVLSAKDYTSLSRFWAKFHFGDCLYRNCWRDLWNVLPEEFVQSLDALQDHKVHQVDSQHIAYFRWDYFLLLFLLAFLLLVRGCVVSYYETEFQWQ